MKKKFFNGKARLIGLAALTMGAASVVPVVAPAITYAETTATEASGTVTETERKTLTRTVKYYYKNDNGTVKPVQAVGGGDFTLSRSTIVTRTVVKDSATGKVISAADWGTAEIQGIESPVITGYTADKTSVPAITVDVATYTPREDVVYYTENPEHKRTYSTETREVSRKITYYRINDDGSNPTQTWSKTQRATLSRVVTTYGDGRKEYGEWTPYTFASEEVAPMTGYTPDITVVPAQTITSGDQKGIDINVYFRKSKSENIVLDDVIKFYTVKFTDGQGNVLKTQQVEQTDNATAPATPKREGYTFAGWDKSFNNVTSDLTVNAKWTKNTVKTTTETKHVERKIYYYHADGSKVLDKNGNHCIAKQYADLTRYVYTDTVTGKVTYGSWAKVDFDEMDVMVYPGYTPSISKIPAFKNVNPTNLPKDINVYYTKNGSVTDNYTGVRYQNGAWIFVRNGKADTSYTGVAQSTTGNWVFVRKGKYDPSYTGVAVTTNGNWVFVRNGRLSLNYSGVAQSTTGNWVYVRNGRFSPGTSGVARSITGNFVYVKNGRYNINYTGVAKSLNTGDQVYVKNGRYTTAFTGYSTNESGKRVYVVNGRVR